MEQPKSRCEQPGWWLRHPGQQEHFNGFKKPHRTLLSSFTESYNHLAVIMAPHKPNFHPFFGILLIPASHGLPSFGMQRGRDHLGKTIEQNPPLHCNVKAFIVLRPPTSQSINLHARALRRRSKRVDFPAFRARGASWPMEMLLQPSEEMFGHKPNAGKVSFYKCRNLLNRTSLPTSLPSVVQTVLPSALREQPRYSNHSSGGDSRRRETQLLERSPAKLLSTAVKPQEYMTEHDAASEPENTTFSIAELRQYLL
ncbi:hypothetical protein V8E51_019322 [Hyaloscypha variabilis]